MSKVTIPKGWIYGGGAGDKGCTGYPTFSGIRPNIRLHLLDTRIYLPDIQVHLPKIRLAGYQISS